MEFKCGLRDFTMKRLKEAWALDGGLDRMPFKDWVKKLDKTILAMFLNGCIYEYYEEKERERLLREEGIIMY